MARFHLAQLNIAKMVVPIDSPLFRLFFVNLDRVNAIADGFPGFVWRLQTESGNATEIRYFGEDTLVNMSVWTSLPHLRKFVYRSAHAKIMRRRRQWFAGDEGANNVLWWIPAGHEPSLEEASQRLDLLRERGPTQRAFTFKQSFGPPKSEDAS